MTVRSGVGETVQTGLCRPVTPVARQFSKTVWEEISNGDDIISVERLRDTVARVGGPLQLQGARNSSSTSGNCPAASATACTWRRCCAPAATC